MTQEECIISLSNTKILWLKDCILLMLRTFKTDCFILICSISNDFKNNKAEYTGH